MAKAIGHLTGRLLLEQQKRKSLLKIRAYHHQFLMGFPLIFKLICLI